jgi:hypothetical protein
VPRYRRRFNIPANILRVNIHRANIHQARSGAISGGSGGPIPGGWGRGGRNAPEPSRRNEKNSPIVTTTTGMLRAVAGSQFVLEADDHRIITYRTTDQTKVEKDKKSADLKNLEVADHLSVDSTADDQGYFTATLVTFQSAGKADERASAARTWIGRCWRPKRKPAV